MYIRYTTIYNNRNTTPGTSKKNSSLWRKEAGGCSQNGLWSTDFLGLPLVHISVQFSDSRRS